MKTYRANPQDHDAVAAALLAKYRGQHANPIDGCTVEIEDHGQDFLEFDIIGRRIIATRPFQGDAWNGRAVMNTALAPGDYLRFGERSWLNYPVTEVRVMGADKEVAMPPYRPRDKDRAERKPRPVAPAASPAPPVRKDAGRDAGATSGYVQRIPRLATTQRACLCCGKPFASQGAHNRLCTSCRARRVGPYDL